MSNLFPKVAIIPITYKCNLRCKMCNIWRLDNIDLTMEALRRLLADKNLAASLESINITGGEPLLRNDLCEIIDELVCICHKLSSITLNTNGVMTKKLGELINEVEKIRSRRRNFSFSIYISLDGVGTIHDEMRGRTGTYKAVMDTLDMLKELKVDHRFQYGLNYTITPENYMFMDDVMRLAQENCIAVDYTYSMKSPMYFSNIDYFEDKVSYSDTAKEFIISKIQEYTRRRLLSYSASYYRNLIAMIKGEKRRVGCIFQKAGFFLHPLGDIYLCWACENKLGNIYQQTFSDMWNNKRREQLQSETLSYCQDCYNNCYVDFQRINIIKKIIQCEEE